MPDEMPINAKKNAPRGVGATQAQGSATLIATDPTIRTQNNELIESSLVAMTRVNI